MGAHPLERTMIYMDLISRDKAQDAVFSKEDIIGYMDKAEDGDINRTIRSAIRLIERVPSAFEGMTNREIISEFVERDDSFAIMVDEVNGTVNIELSLDFWNAPYKKEGE